MDRDAGSEVKRPVVTIGGEQYALLRHIRAGAMSVVWQAQAIRGKSLAGKLVDLVVGSKRPENYETLPISGSDLLQYLRQPEPAFPIEGLEPDQDLGELVAIKVPKPEAEEALKKEAQRLDRLKRTHWAVALRKDLSSDRECPCLIEAWVRGQQLDKGRQPFAERDGLFIGRQILAAVDEVFSRPYGSLVLTDSIKANSIFWNEDNRTITIIDLGLVGDDILDIERITLPLFGGTLHRILAGTTVGEIQNEQFLLDVGWIGAGEAQSGWQSLSFGTRRLIRKLLLREFARDLQDFDSLKQALANVRRALEEQNRLWYESDAADLLRRARIAADEESVNLYDVARLKGQAFSTEDNKRYLEQLYAVITGHLQAGQHDSALLDLRWARERFPTDHHTRRAYLAIATGRTEYSQDQYRRVWEAVQVAVDALGNGDTAWQVGQVEEAVRQYQKAVDLLQRTAETTESRTLLIEAELLHTLGGLTLTLSTKEVEQVPVSLDKARGHLTQLENLLPGDPSLQCWQSEIETTERRWGLRHELIRQITGALACGQWSEAEAQLQAFGQAGFDHEDIASWQETAKAGRAFRGAIEEGNIQAAEELLDRLRGLDLQGEAIQSSEAELELLRNLVAAEEILPVEPIDLDEVHAYLRDAHNHYQQVDRLLPQDPNLAGWQDRLGEAQVSCQQLGAERESALRAIQGLLDSDKFDQAIDLLEAFQKRFKYAQVTDWEEIIRAKQELEVSLSNQDLASAQKALERLRGKRPQGDQLVGRLEAQLELCAAIQRAEELLATSHGEQASPALEDATAQVESLGRVWPEAPSLQIWAARLDSAEQRLKKRQDLLGRIGRALANRRWAEAQSDLQEFESEGFASENLEEWRRAAESGEAFQDALAAQNLQTAQDSLAQLRTLDLTEIISAIQACEAELALVKNLAEAKSLLQELPVDLDRVHAHLMEIEKQYSRLAEVLPQEPDLIKWQDCHQKIQDMYERGDSERKSQGQAIEDALVRGDFTKAADHLLQLKGKFRHPGLPAWEQAVAAGQDVLAALKEDDFPKARTALKKLRAARPEAAPAVRNLHETISDRLIRRVQVHGFWNEFDQAVVYLEQLGEHAPHHPGLSSFKGLRDRRDQYSSLPIATTCSDVLDHWTQALKQAVEHGFYFAPGRKSLLLELARAQVLRGNLAAALRIVGQAKTNLSEALASQPFDEESRKEVSCLLANADLYSEQWTANLSETVFQDRVEQLQRAWANAQPDEPTCLLALGIWREIEHRFPGRIRDIRPQRSDIAARLLELEALALQQDHFPRALANLGMVQQLAPEEQGIEEQLAKVDMRWRQARERDLEVVEGKLEDAFDRAGRQPLATLMHRLEFLRITNGLERAMDLLKQAAPEQHRPEDWQRVFDYMTRAKEWLAQCALDTEVVPETIGAQDRDFLSELCQAAGLVVHTSLNRRYQDLRECQGMQVTTPTLPFSGAESLWNESWNLIAFLESSRQLFSDLDQAERWIDMENKSRNGLREMLKTRVQHFAKQIEKWESLEDDDEAPCEEAPHLQSILAQAMDRQLPNPSEFGWWSQVIESLELKTVVIKRVQGLRQARSFVEQGRYQEALQHYKQVCPDADRQGREGA